MSVLLENNQWRIFHILTSEDIDGVIYRFFQLHSGLKIMNSVILIHVVKTIFYSFAYEDKIHIFAPPCNILYI